MAILAASVSDLLHMLQSHVMLLHQLAMLYAKTYGLAAHQLIAMVKTHMLLYDTPETISFKKWWHSQWHKNPWGGIGPSSERNSLVTQSTGAHCDVYQ